MKFSDQRLVKWFQHLRSPYLTSKHSNYPQQRDPHGTAFPCLLYLETTDHSTTIRNEPLVELTNAKCKAFPSRFKGYRVLSESSGRDPRWKYVLLRHTKNLINHRFREVSGKVVLNVACLESRNTCWATRKKSESGLWSGRRAWNIMKCRDTAKAWWWIGPNHLNNLLISSAIWIIRSRVIK